MVYNCILQLHSIFGEMPSCLVTASPSIIFCKARLDTSVLRFACLHSIYITKVVTNNKIIAVTNRKTSLVKLLRKNVLLGNTGSYVECLSFKYKNSFLL